jgi:hypothetical protein
MLAGTVFTAEGDCLPGATVRLHDLGLGYRIHEARSGSAGEFRFGRIAARDQVELDVHLPGYVSRVGVKVPVGSLRLEVVLGREEDAGP